jgi:hypothetical protein
VNGYVDEVAYILSSAYDQAKAKGDDWCVRAAGAVHSAMEIVLGTLVSGGCPPIEWFYQRILRIHSGDHA